jgi:hypothetical protein
MALELLGCFLSNWYVLAKFLMMMMMQNSVGLIYKLVPNMNTHINKASKDPTNLV